jgi:hypothetical protein
LVAVREYKQRWLTGTLLSFIGVGSAVVIHLKVVLHRVEWLLPNWVFFDFCSGGFDSSDGRFDVDYGAWLGYFCTGELHLEFC